MLGVPALRALRQRFPGAEVTLVAPMPQARVATWDRLVDRAVDFGEPALARLIGGEAREWPSVLESADTAVVWLRDHARVVGNLERLGVAHVMGCAPLDAVPARRHVAEWLTNSLASLGVTAKAEQDAITPAWAMGDTIRAPIVLHPGSGSARKNWTGWPEVIDALRPHPVAIVAGPADEAALTALQAAWPSAVAAPRVLSGLTLEQLAAVLAGARLYLGNDSGVSHLAAALGAPTVVVFGPTDPEIWRPVGPRVFVTGGCSVADGIFAAAPRWPTVAEVVAAARRALG